MPPNCGPEDKTTVAKYLTYTYKDKHGNAHAIKLPLVHIYMRSPTVDTETVALLDTGATKTILAKEYADILSLEYVKDEQGNLIESETVGAGGTFICHVAYVQRMSLKKRTASFCTLTNIPVLVPEREGVVPYVILGRDYVFNRFDITFHETRKKVTFAKLRK